MDDLMNIVDNYDLGDICRALCLTTAEYISFQEQIKMYKIENNRVLKLQSN